MCVDYQMIKKRANDDTTSGYNASPSSRSMKNLILIGSVDQTNEEYIQTKEAVHALPYMKH